MSGVTGIGGIFFKAEDPQGLKAWYQQHLGINGLFFLRDVNDSAKTCYTVWNVFPTTAKLFMQCTKEYIFNYRVDDLVSLLDRLKSDGVHIIGEMERDEDGKFAYVMDLEDNKIVLWEPSDKIPEAIASNLDRVTGLGGLFFKSNDNKKLKEWYSTHLGFNATQWGCSFLWTDPNGPAEKVSARTEWSPFVSDTDYFQPSQKQFMFNYRVKDLPWLIQVLKEEGVIMAGGIDEFSYGKFAWILDPEGNKIELWEPKDDGF